MKISNHFSKITLFVLFLSCSFSTIYAQNTKTRTSRTISISSSDDNSSSSTNSNYNFASSFSKKVTPEVEAYLVKKLGSPTNKSSRKTKYWNTIDNQEIENFKVKLSRGKISIKYSSKEENDENNKKIGKMVLYLSNLISNESSQTSLKFKGDISF